MCFKRLNAEVGLHLRPELLSWISKLQAVGSLGFCEVHLEALLKPSVKYFDLIDTMLNCGIRINLHSVGILPDRNFEPHLRAIEKLTKWSSPSLLSVHLASGYQMNDFGESFTRPSYSDQFFNLMESHLVALSSNIQVPVAIENIANYTTHSDNANDELEFLAATAKATGTSVVFDVSNHLTTYPSLKTFTSHAKLVSELPLAHLHVSGGRWINGRYFDTHADPLQTSHIELLSQIVALSSAIPLYERDYGFERIEEIEREIQWLLKSVDSSRTRERFI